MNQSVYLDYAATSPMHPKVIDEMSKAMRSHFGNASSTHQYGRLSRGLLDEARIVFAKSIQAKPNEILMTSGGTESDNTAILKTAEKFGTKKRHIITTNVEHQAVLKPMEYLEALGYEVTYLPVNEEGFVTADQVEQALREDTFLVSIMFGNNEVGTVMPIADIGQLLKDKEQSILFHTDAVQAYGSKAIDVNQLNVDLLSVSAHKIGGPKGIGFLYCREGLSLPSLILGGEQETKRRAGTENIPAVVGFKTAVELMLRDQAQRVQNYLKLKARLLNQLEKFDIAYKINGNLEKSLPQIISLHLTGVDAERMLIKLDLSGIAVSAGSACTAGNIDPSHVLTAMYGEKHPAISETIRISMGFETKEQDIDRIVTVLDKEINKH
ncbi:cysteine desulfurase family protein [Marinilactibacillus sp. Marseille-P9653]|uniref:cysteine desulfurase family protein n=1 Tax=Marinilactibacillus sp. Marseille-P9653 TaxID=2866583 RepID=UPI001CE47CCE|nr:cysteine desulfurase family protein [Marinilactibacillus sp. Marseille-P9653]